MARRTVRIAKTPVNETTSTKARTTNHCCRPNFFIGSSLNARIPYEQLTRTNVGRQKCRDVAIAALTFLDGSKREFSWRDRCRLPGNPPDNLSRSRPGKLHRSCRSLLPGSSESARDQISSPSYYRPSWFLSPARTRGFQPSRY